MTLLFIVFLPYLKRRMQGLMQYADLMFIIFTWKKVHFPIFPIITRFTGRL